MADTFGNLTSDSRIPIFDSMEDVEKVAKKFTGGKPEAFLVYDQTAESKDDNNIDRNNCVVESNIVLFFRYRESFGEENDRVHNAIDLKNAVINAVLADRMRDGNAHALIVGGEGIWGTEVGKAETDKAKAPIYKIVIPVKCAFQVSDTGR